VNALRTLAKAGADVPQLFESGDNAVLMGHVGDRNSSAAGLMAADLDGPAAARLFERVCGNLRKMLATHIVHGDLSGYNILYWQGEITIIDFPQVSDPRRNPNSAQFFTRDVTRVCDCFAQWMHVPDPLQLARDLWAEAYRADLNERTALINDKQFHKAHD
jgi:RIO kinase 1